MRRWSGAIGLALGLLVVACGEAEEQPDVAVMAAGTESLTEPACQPSERMDVVGRTSPYDSVSVAVGEGTAKICYGRPALKGRTMLGGDAVPFDTLWRTGANEPTTIHVNVPASIAGIQVEPGSYSLYTIPRAGETWTLIVNRATAQWGHESSYTPEVRAQEAGRAEVQAETLDTRVEQLTFQGMGSEAGAGGEHAGHEGVVLEWQNSRVHIPITPAG